MKKVLLAPALFLLASVQGGLAKDQGEFNLKVHITAVEMQQGNNPIRGGGSTDSNGNYSSHVRGGESYTWHLLTCKIEGDPVTYKIHLWRGLRHAEDLHIGDYLGRWNKNGNLEIQYTNRKSKLDHETFYIESESKDEPVQAKQ